MSDALLVSNAALRFSPPEQDGEGGLLRSLMARPWWRTPKSAARKGVEQIVHRVKNGALEPVAITIGASDGTRTEVAKGELAVDDALAVAVRTGPR